MKEYYLIAAGIVGGVTTALFGGWSSALTTLVIFIGIDYLSGIIAAFFGKSVKTADGKLSSEAGYRGLLKKAMMMAVVIITYRLDLIVNSGFLVEAVVIALIANETISITENLAAMGVPIPGVLKRMLAALNEKAESRAADKFADNVIDKLENKDGNDK